MSALGDLIQVPKICLSALMASRETLLREMSTHLVTGSWQFTPMFSGRVAIKQAAELLAKRDGSRRALVPTYICNVVPMALEQAGLQLEWYNFDSAFEPTKADLINLVNTGEIGLLLLCPLYGASGGVYLLDDPEFQSAISNNNVHLLVDVCQNMEIGKRVQNQYPQGNKDVSLIYSFNNKNTPGIMGGGIAYIEDVGSDGEALNATEGRQHPPTLPFYKYAFSKMVLEPVKKITGKRKSKKEGFEFTKGTSFPYEFKHYKMPKLQLAVAVSGLRKLPKYHDKQVENLDRLNGNFTKLPYVEHSAYVLASKEIDIPAGLRKSPYSKHSVPHQSVHPSLNILANGGFENG